MLVDYYSGSEDEARDTRPAKKRKLDNGESATSLPPLPAAFRSLYAINVRAATADDPQLHGGRTRQVAHHEGNWPAHVYLEWHPSREDLDKLEKLVQQIQEADRSVDTARKVHSSLRSDLGVPLPLHVSLSAPLVLETGTKDGLVEELTRTILSSRAHGFNVSPVAVEWLPNSDASRVFLALKLDKPDNDDLNKLLRACNEWAKKHGLSELYTNLAPNPDAAQLDQSSAFHVSIAWALGKPKHAEKELLLPPSDIDLSNFEIRFNEVKVKIGNVVKDVELSK